MNIYWKEKPLAGDSYFAVIFTSKKKEVRPGYEAMDEKTMQEALAMDGFLGYQSINTGLDSIFISFWKDEKAIDLWKRASTHLSAKQQAPQWYEYYHSTICKVIHQKEFYSN